MMGKMRRVEGAAIVTTDFVLKCAGFAWDLFGPNLIVTAQV